MAAKAEVNGQVVEFQFAVGDVVALKGGYKRGTIYTLNLHLAGERWTPRYEVMYEEGCRFTPEFVLTKVKQD